MPFLPTYWARLKQQHSVLGIFSTTQAEAFSTLERALCLGMGVGCTWISVFFKHAVRNAWEQSIQLPQGFAGLVDMLLCAGSAGLMTFFVGKPLVKTILKKDCDQSKGAQGQIALLAEVWAATLTIGPLVHAAKYCITEPVPACGPVALKWASSVAMKLLVVEPASLAVLVALDPVLQKLRAWLTGSEPADNQSKGKPRNDSVMQEGRKRSMTSFSVHDSKFQDLYDLDKEKLGEGSYGSVRKAKNRSTGALCAVKSISKAQLSNIDSVEQEIAIMDMMDHPNIINLCDTFVDYRNIYLVMELSTGGDLFDKIIESGRFSEVQAAIVMQQIISAIHYMHNNLVCHRDLKPENFLFMSKDPIENNLLKIIDFGLSSRFEPGKDMTTKAGTAYYAAPQVLAGKYDQLSDLWSAGVIMYVMLCGCPPFSGETEDEVMSKVSLGKFSFPGADWKNVSQDAKILISMLLKMNPRERFSAEQALNHEWIKNKAPAAKNVPLQSNVVNNLRGFRSANKLKKAALHIIAGQFHEDHIKHLREVFMTLDGDGDGLLTMAEMRQGFAKAGLKDIPADLKQIMEDVDCDGSGVIDYTCFLAATLDKCLYLHEDACWSAFCRFDKNGDGKISSCELRAVLENEDLNEIAGAKAIAELMKEIDTDGDGEIDFEEFMVMMRGAAG